MSPDRASHTEADRIVTSIEGDPSTGDREVDDALHGLGSPDRDVRQPATLALGTLADPAAAPWVVSHLLKEEDFFVRDTLTWAATRIPCAATPLLLAALENRETTTRVQALHTLSKIADPATTDTILPLAFDDDQAVAAKARWALTRIGDPRALPALTAHLGAGDDEARNALTRNLTQFGPAAVTSLVTVLTSDEPAVRRHAAEVLCHLGTGAEDATDALATALKDSDSEVRLSAAMALFDLPTGKAQTILSQHADAEDPRLRAIARRARE